MPVYVCTAALGRLTPVQKTEIAKSITAIYREVTGAPRYMVQVIFHTTLRRAISTSPADRRLRIRY